jgi:hypothetical protein
MNSTRNSLSNRALTALFTTVMALIAATAFAVPVLVPDNGGTAQLPILSDYTGQTPMQITAGLPPASTIDIAAVLKAPLSYEEIPGGTLGGTQAVGGGTSLQWNMTGTGLLSSYNRVMNVPLSSLPVTFAATPPLDTQSGIEVHSAPRTLNDPLQCFSTELVGLFGLLTNPSANDPDFDFLRVQAGSTYGYPSPGHTNLLQNGTLWEVDSFFDVTYRIDFIGKPGGPLAGMSGSSVGTVRFSLGDPIPCIPEPASATLAVIFALLAFIRRRS